MDTSDDSNKNFFKHVFNFDDESKSDILNILQYALIALIPIVILNKTIGKYVPEADDRKSSLELSAELVIQIIVTFMGLLIIHRMITFVPTKLGEKVTILVERVIELWEGKPADKKKKNGKNGVKVSQPISGQQMITSSMSQPNYTDGTAISSLPTNDSQQMPSQQMPNYDTLHRQDTTPMVGAASPGGQQESFGIMAANEVLGGSFGSSW